MAEARATADAMLDLFWDDEHGGLFTTGRDGERLITRDKDVLDNATPSANGLAAFALLRLAALTGADTYEARAGDIIGLLGGAVAQHPTAFCQLLAAVDLATAATTEVVVPGRSRPDLVETVTRRFRPRAVLAWGEHYDSPLFAGRDDGVAYVCERYACRQPTADAGELAALLS